MPARPAFDLPIPGAPRLGHLLVALGAVLVHDLPPTHHETNGEVGVFGKRVGAPATHIVQRQATHATHRSTVLRNEREIHARLLVHLVAAGTLEVEQPREQIAPSVLRHHAPHDSANLRIEERSHQPLEQTRRRRVVGVEDDEDLAGRAIGRVEQRGGFSRAAVGPMHGDHASRVARRVPVDDAPRTVRGRVIDRNDRQPVRGIIGAEQRGQRMADYGLFIVCGYQHRDGGPVGGAHVHEGMPLPSEQPVQREHVLTHRVHTDDRHDCAKNDFEPDNDHGHGRRPGQLAPHA